ncbi:hypothetical protein Tco_1517144 [Tanacetum coccineum]
MTYSRPRWFVSSGVFSASVEREFVGDEEVYPQLPGPDNTMHERPSGKVGMYTRSCNAGFNRISVSNIVKDQAPPTSEYNMEHVNTLIAQASPFLRFPEEFLCWVGISRNYLLKKDTFPRFEYENGEEMDLNAFIRTADPRKVRIVERPMTENERPIVTVAKHRKVTLLPTKATTVTTIATTVAIPADVGKNKSVSHPSVFGASSSSEKTDRTLSLFTGRSGSGFAAGSIRAEEVTDAGLEEIYVPEWTVTKGFEFNDGRSCANMIDHFTPPAFFKTVRGMEHEQLFAEFNVSAARNLSLSSEVRMRAEYNILEKRKWRSLAEEKDSLLGAKDKEIEELRSQLLKAKEESVVVAQLRARVSSLEAIEGSLRGEVASVKGYNDLLEQECSVLRLQVTSLESTVAEKDRELSDLEISSSSLLLEVQRNQMHEAGDFISADLVEKLEMYEEALKRFRGECFHFRHLPITSLQGRRWLLTHGMQLLMAKCLNSTEYMEALGHAFGRAIEKGMQEGLAVGLSTVKLADICLNKLSNKKDASTWDVMDLLRLWTDAVRRIMRLSDLVDVVPKDVTPGPEGEKISMPQRR